MISSLKLGIELFVQTHHDSNNRCAKTSAADSRLYI